MLSLAPNMVRAKGDRVVQPLLPLILFSRVLGMAPVTDAFPFPACAWLLSLALLAGSARSVLLHLRARTGQHGQRGLSLALGCLLHLLLLARHRGVAKLTGAIQTGAVAGLLPTQELLRLRRRCAWTTFAVVFSILTVTLAELFSPEHAMVAADRSWGSLEQLLEAATTAAQRVVVAIASLQYSSLALLLQREFRTINSRLKGMDDASSSFQLGPQWLPRVRGLASEHARLRTLAMTFSSRFSWIVLCVVSSQLQEVFHLLIMVMTEQWKWTNAGLMWTNVIRGATMLVHAVQVLSMLVTCNSLYQEADATRRRVACLMGLENVTSDVRNEIETFFRESSIAMPRFSAGGLFILDPTLVTSASYIILTYAISVVDITKSHP